MTDDQHTDSRRRVDASRAHGALHIEHCDVPADMTLGEWRRHCAAERRAAAPARVGVGHRLRRLLRG